jgi:hypothetical protein
MGFSLLFVHCIASLSNIAIVLLLLIFLFFVRDAICTATWLPGLLIVMRRTAPFSPSDDVDHSTGKYSLSRLGGRVVGKTTPSSLAILSI